MTNGHCRSTIRGWFSNYRPPPSPAAPKTIPPPISIATHSIFTEAPLETEVLLESGEPSCGPSTARGPVTLPDELSSGPNGPNGSNVLNTPPTSQNHRPTTWCQRKRRKYSHLHFYHHRLAGSSSTASGATAQHASIPCAGSSSRIQSAGPGEGSNSQLTIEDHYFALSPVEAESYREYVARYG